MSKVILIISLLVAISICDFFYILYIKRQLKFEKENSLKYLLYQRKYYESLVDKDKDIRRFYHDIRRHINILNVMANENHINEMKVYLTELGGEVEHFYLPHTQNLIVDYILNNVISELQQFSNFSYQIRGKFSEKLHISNRDLSALIGNALENAKEALIKVEKEKRLELEIKSHNQFVFIMLSNTLNELPPLEKDEIINDALQIMMPEYLYKYKDNDFMPFWTSGSTGKCLELYWKLADCRRSLYPLWYYRYKFYGIYTWDKHIKFNTISGIENNEPWMVERDYSLEFSKSNLNEQKLLDIYKAIFDYKPVWLLLQPCIAELLCWVKEKNNLLTIDSVKYIECTGEMLSDELRMRLVKNFMCTVSNQYGMNEVNTIAYECPQGNMHCMESSVCVEILNNNGEVLPDNMEGNIYVTSWQNQVMPFIRYGTSDIGILRKNTCSCGHSGKLLNLRKGRKNDWILTKNGERINVYVFIRSIEIVNMLTEHSIIQFQIIQIDYEEFLVKMVLNDDILNISKLFIENIGHESLKQATYHFQLCEAIFPNETGKNCVFSSALSKEGF